MAHKIMPVALHKNHWKPGKSKKKADKPESNKDQMRSFLRSKKGR